MLLLILGPSTSEWIFFIPARVCNPARTMHQTEQSNKQHTTPQHTTPTQPNPTLPSDTHQYYRIDIEQPPPPYPLYDLKYARERK